MEKAEFDKFADEYRSLHAQNVKAYGKGPEFFAEYKIAEVAAIVKGNAMKDELAILDFGSGIGNSVPFFNKYLPKSKLTCVDVSERSLEICEERFPQMADYRVFDGKKIPAQDNQFDVVFSACVFHHVDECLHVGLFSELRRVLNPSGLLVIFEHNPWNPLTVRAVNDCPFDENAKLISAPCLSARLKSAGFSSVQTKYRLFLPGMLGHLRFMEPLLGWIPLGAQYYVIGKK
jgi:SAM-dependent methyltransferase